MKNFYGEGTVFNVPLTTEGYAHGVVARESRGILFGYFFGPRLMPGEDFSIQTLKPNTAILRARFVDFGLVHGEWKIIGQIQEWDREQWPLPDFVRRDPLDGKNPRLIRYSETDLARSIIIGSVENGLDLPQNGLYGSGAIEITLTEMLQRSSKI